jgi:hypothetical protein
MTKEERIAILNVIVTADGGCPTCVENLFSNLRKALPNEPWSETAKANEISDYDRRMLTEDE